MQFSRAVKSWTLLSDAADVYLCGCKTAMKSFLFWEPQLETTLADKMVMPSPSHEIYGTYMPPNECSLSSLDGNLQSVSNCLNNHLEIENDVADGKDPCSGQDNRLNGHTLSLSIRMMGNIPSNQATADWCLKYTEPDLTTSDAWCDEATTVSVFEVGYIDTDKMEIQTRIEGHLQDVGLKYPEQLPVVNVGEDKVMPQRIVEGDIQLESSLLSLAATSQDEDCESNDLDLTEVPEFVMADYCMEYLQVKDGDNMTFPSRSPESDLDIQNDIRLVVSERSGIEIRDDCGDSSNFFIDPGMRSNDHDYKVPVCLFSKDGCIPVCAEDISDDCVRQHLKENVKNEELVCEINKQGCLKSADPDSRNGQWLPQKNKSTLSGVDCCEGSKKATNGIISDRDEEEIGRITLEKDGSNNENESRIDDNVQGHSASCELIGVTCNGIYTKSLFDDFGIEIQTETSAELGQTAEKINSENSNIIDAPAMGSDEILVPPSDNKTQDNTEEEHYNQIYGSQESDSDEVYGGQESDSDEVYGGQESDSDEVLSEDEATSSAAMNMKPTCAPGFFQKSYSVLRRNGDSEFLQTVRAFHSYSDGTEV